MDLRVATCHQSCCPAPNCPSNSMFGKTGSSNHGLPMFYTGATSIGNGTLLRQHFAGCKRWTGFGFGVQLFTRLILHPLGFIVEWIPHRSIHSELAPQMKAIV